MTLPAAVTPALGRFLGAPAGISRTATRLTRVGMHALAAHRRARTGEPGENAGTRARELHRVCAQLTRAQGIRIISTGRVPASAALVVANHQSYLDPLVLGALFGFAPVCKAEVRSWPVFGDVMRSLGTIFVERKSAHSGAAVLGVAQRALEGGVSVLCFPEGTTTDGSVMLPFRRGMFGVALAASVPVVPVAIEYGESGVSWTGDQTFAPHYLKLTSRREVSARVRFGDPLHPHSFDDADSLATAAHAEVGRLFRRNR